MSDYYKIIVSPENVAGDLSVVDYNGTPVGVYSAMTEVVSSGPNGASLLTDLSVPLLFRQTAVDAGYYSPFDGAVLQKDVVANFIFSSTTSSPYVYNIYNTSDQFQKFLDLSSYKVDWGDGTPKQIIVKIKFTMSELDFDKHLYFLITLTNSLSDKSLYKSASF